MSEEESLLEKAFKPSELILTKLVLECLKLETKKDYKNGLRSETVASIKDYFQILVNYKEYLLKFILDYLFLSDDVIKMPLKYKK